MDIYLTIRDVGGGISKGTVDAQQASDIVFPIDLAGPITTPPIKSTVIQSSDAVTDGVDLSFDEVKERVEIVRAEKLERFNQALDLYRDFHGKFHILVPSSVLACGDEAWAFIYPELVSSLLVATSPKRIFIDLGAGNSYNFERVTAIASLYTKMHHTTNQMDSALVNRVGAIDVTEPPKFGLVCSLNNAKSVVEYIGSKPNFFICPFLYPESELEPSLAELHVRTLAFPEIVPVIARLNDSDMENAHEIFGRYKMTPMFWSPGATIGIDCTKKYYDTVPARAIGPVVIWEKKSRSSKMMGVIDPGQKIDIRVFDDSAGIVDEVLWGELVDKKNGKSLGFIILVHQGQEKVTIL